MQTSHVIAGLHQESVEEAEQQLALVCELLTGVHVPYTLALMQVTLRLCTTTFQQPCRLYPPKRLSIIASAYCDTSHMYCVVQSAAHANATCSSLTSGLLFMYRVELDVGLKLTWG